MHRQRTQLILSSMNQLVRFASSRTNVDRWFQMIQTPPKTNEREKSIEVLRHLYNNNESLPSNFFQGILHRWQIDQPKETALWIDEKSEKLSFHDVHDQAIRLRNVLSGKEFQLATGRSILVLLPHQSKEERLLQLTCLQNGWVFCPYDPKDLKRLEFPKRLRLLTIDCVVTNEENLELIRELTHNSIRPLKKGLYTNSTRSTPLPVGWSNLNPEANYADQSSVSFENVSIPSNAAAIRLLSQTNQLIEYSRQQYFTHLLSAGFWLNRNKSSRLIWMNNDQQMISMAAWLFGSSLFCKSIENVSSMIETFDQKPIDTFCTSSDKYKLLDRSIERKLKGNLEQLFALGSVDPDVKKRWFSLTKLDIHDDYQSDIFDNEEKLSQRAEQNLVDLNDKRHVSNFV